MQWKRIRGTVPGMDGLLPGMDVSAEPADGAGGAAAVSPDLVCAQHAALSRQVPLLYALLVINTAILSATHMECAPLLLTVVVPGLLCLPCVLRGVQWMLRDGKPVTATEAAARLRTVVCLTPVLAAGFSLWALSMYSYGTESERSQVSFYMGVTVVIVMFCLMQVRRAALWSAAVMGGCFTVFFVATGRPVLMATALNLVLVLGGLAWLLTRSHADFANLIRSRRELVLRHAEAERLAGENRRLAGLDLLTGLPNRRRFLLELEAALAEARAHGRRLAVALLDLDGFKGVNDVHGHAVGDALLAEAGRRLAALSDARVSVARLGGDEFGVVLTGDPDDAAVLALGQGLCTALREGELVGGLVGGLVGSVGLASFPEAGQTAKQLFERADYALYHAKQHRRGEAVPFTAEHETMIREAARLDQALARADLAHELTLCFQPIVAVLPGHPDRLVGFEALARWNSPELGGVPPDRFIPAAERLGLVGRITEVLLARALAEAVRWPAALRISFNLSARDLACARTMTRVLELVLDSGLDPTRLDLEVTETAMMRDVAEATAALAPLRQLGANVSLDDFGSGYSSLAHVHRLRPDKIKVDRCFVADLHASPLSRDIVRTVLDLSRTIGAACIVEGVETPEQRYRLMALGCTTMQGYLFGRPVADVSELLRVPVEA